jgi:predicted CoA-binding protein
MVDHIQEFLSRRRIAIVGVSHEPKEFSRMVFRAFRKRGYDVVPVNPNIRVVEGQYCFPRVTDVQPPVEAALVMTPPAVSEHVVNNCLAAGVPLVWLYRHCPEAEGQCAAAGLPVIAGECPMMYLERAGWIHRVHRWFHDRRSGHAAASGML